MNGLICALSADWIDSKSIWLHLSSNTITVTCVLAMYKQKCSSKYAVQFPSQKWRKQFFMFLNECMFCMVFSSILQSFLVAGFGQSCKIRHHGGKTCQFYQTICIEGNKNVFFSSSFKYRKMNFAKICFRTWFFRTEGKIDNLISFQSAHLQLWIKLKYAK